MSLAIKRLAELELEAKKLRAKIDVERANKTILCGCGALHKVKDCDAVNSMYYVPPSGCSEGAYWTYQEKHVVCPVTGHRNRLLYSSKYRVPWERRSDYAHSAEMQFNRMYGHLFKSQKEECKGTSYKWWNSDYVDKHHDKFGIDIGYKGKV